MRFLETRNISTPIYRYFISSVCNHSCNFVNLQNHKLGFLSSENIFCSKSYKEYYIRLRRRFEKWNIAWKSNFEFKIKCKKAKCKRKRRLLLMHTQDHRLLPEGAESELREDLYLTSFRAPTVSVDRRKYASWKWNVGVGARREY